MNGFDLLILMHDNLGMPHSHNWFDDDAPVCLITPIFFIIFSFVIGLYIRKTIKQGGINDE